MRCKNARSDFSTAGASIAKNRTYVNTLTRPTTWFLSRYIPVHEEYTKYITAVMQTTTHINIL